MVMAEFEEAADAILPTFGNLPQALLEIINGRREPSGLFPLQIPENMDMVEEQFEDVSFDMICHVDKVQKAICGFLSFLFVFPVLFQRKCNSKGSIATSSIMDRDSTVQHLG